MPSAGSESICVLKDPGIGNPFQRVLDSSHTILQDQNTCSKHQTGKPFHRVLDSSHSFLQNQYACSKIRIENPFHSKSYGFFTLLASKEKKMPVACYCWQIFYSVTEVFSVADPDPHGSAFILVGWIPIRIWNTDLDPGGPKCPIKVKKIQILKC
jgi:hypothetical protein